ncbi:MAG: acetyl-CoA carboxylase biotin carboxyl carrier protein subunit [Myxococcota bacterium]
MKYDVELDGVTRCIELSNNDGVWMVRVDGGPAREIRAVRDGATGWRLTHDADTHRVGVGRRGDRVSTVIDGVPRHGTVLDPRKRGLEDADGAGEGVLTTQMPGAIVRVPVSVGDTVTEGQVIVVVEAMKMENEFRAPFDGVVEALSVEAGQAVEAGAVLARLAPSDAETD